MSVDPRDALPWRIAGRSSFQPAPRPSFALPAAAHLKRSLWVAAALMLAVIAMRAAALEDLVAATLISLVALAPVYLWIQQGGKDMPILPVVAVAHVMYFAFPLVSEHPELVVYEPGERLAAGMTVVVFLVCATAAWLVAASFIVRHSKAEDPDPHRALSLTVAAAISCGIVFQYLALGQHLSSLGEWYSVLRSFILNFLYAATFVAGVLRGRGQLAGPLGWLCLAGVIVNVIMSWTTLFLVGGLVLWSVYVVGLMIGAQRLPLKELLPVFVLALVLHAGKAEMREQYWSDGLQTDAVSFVQIPARMAEWLHAGVHALILSDSADVSILERASLMQMVLRAQHMSPQPVPFLQGETYALIPNMLVPRVWDPDKPASQAGMDMLNIRYGVLTTEDVKKTAVGWGLMSEAYANFGFYGVIACGLIFGAFLGFVTRWASGAPPLSARAMFAVVVTAFSVSLETDAAGYITALFQAAVAVYVLSRFTNMPLQQRS